VGVFDTIIVGVGEGDVLVGAAAQPLTASARVDSRISKIFFMVISPLLLYFV
jgi:hypothetical protein